MVDQLCANVGMNRQWNTCWSAPTCQIPVPMKSWKSSTPELAPAFSTGREQCSQKRTNKKKNMLVFEIMDVTYCDIHYLRHQRYVVVGRSILCTMPM